MSAFWHLEFEGDFLRSWKMCATLQYVVSVFPNISISESVNKISQKIKLTPIFLKQICRNWTSRIKNTHFMRSARRNSVSCSSRITALLDDTLLQPSSMTRHHRISSSTVQNPGVTPRAISCNV